MLQTIMQSIFFPIHKKEISIEEQLNGTLEPTTQYGKMMNELGINLIHAHSSQAKGRIERLWNTLHDRLITEFRINNITLPSIPKILALFAALNLSI